MKDNTQHPRLALTYLEVAKSLGLSERSVWSLVASHQLKAIRLGRSVRVPLAELERFVTDRLKTDAQAAT